MKFSTNREIEKAAKKATEELQEMLQDTAQKISRDQAEWLDMVMKDILPPHLYAAGLCGDLNDEIHEYLVKHGFSILFIPDSISIRVMRNGNVHAEFKTKLSVDGEPVEMVPTSVSNN